MQRLVDEEEWVSPREPFSTSWDLLQKTGFITEEWIKNGAGNGHTCSGDTTHGPSFPYQVFTLAEKSDWFVFHVSIFKTRTTFFKTDSFGSCTSSVIRADLPRIRKLVEKNADYDNAKNFRLRTTAKKLDCLLSRFCWGKGEREICLYITRNLAASLNLCHALENFQAN